jgi:REP-associated tyrosine transposase
MCFPILERVYQKKDRVTIPIYTVETLERRVLGLYHIGKEELYSKSRQKVRAEARSVFCYWAVRELGLEGTQMTKRLNMSQPGVAYAVKKGERIVKQNHFQMMK